MKILVYTANFGLKDDAPKLINKDAVATTQVDFVCVTDNPSLSSHDYSMDLVERRFSDITKNARSIKVNGIADIEKYDIALWHDSSVMLDCARLNELVQTVENRTLSTFQHQDNCVYSEGRSCIRMRKDNPMRIVLQLAWYALRHRYPVRNGLYETTIVCYNVNKYFGSPLQRLWWKHIRWLSRRDQLSLPFAIFRTSSAKEIGIISGTGFNNVFSVYRGHSHYDYHANPMLNFTPDWTAKLGTWLIFKLEKHLS